MSSTNQRALQANLRTLQDAPKQMSVLARHYKETVRAIQAERPYLMPRDYQRRLERAKEEHQQQTARLRVQCLQAEYDLRAAAELARGESGRHEDPARAILEERAWRRILGVLQRQESLPEMTARARELIAEAGRRGDLATLRAIRSELPAFLEAREAPDQRARRIAAGKSFAESDGTTRALLDATAQAGRAYLPPEEQMAYDIEQQLRPFDQAIMGNLARLEQLADDPNGTYSNVGLVGWSGGYIPAGSTIEEPARPNGTSADLPED